MFPKQSLFAAVCGSRYMYKQTHSVIDYFQAFRHMLTNHCFNSAKKSIKTDRLEHETLQTVQLLPPCYSL